MSSIVTVAVPARNRGHLLREALESVLRQTHTDFVVYVSDNSSPGDRSVSECIAGLGDSRISVRRHDPTLPMLENWKHSLMQSDSKYVAWLHDDDIWPDDHLERALAGLEQNPNAVLYSCSSQHFSVSGPGELQKVRGYEDCGHLVRLSPRESFPLWLYRNNSQCSAAVFRRESLDRLDWGPLDFIYSCDYHLMFQLVMQGEWLYDPVSVIYYREHAQSVTSSNHRAVALAVVQQAYVQQQMALLALRTGGWGSDDLFREIMSWGRERRAGLIVALYARHMPAAIRTFVRRVHDASGDLYQAPVTSRNIALAGRLGRWYLAVADQVNRVRLWWRPFA